jgi:hypothetical protein
VLMSKLILPSSARLSTKRSATSNNVKGAILFSSSRHFVNLSSVTEDASTLMIDIEDALTLDFSAVAAIQGIPPVSRGLPCVFCQ